MRTISTDRIARVLDRALGHERATNRRVRRLLRWATNPVNAHTITRQLRDHSRSLVGALNAEGHLDDYCTMGVLFRTDAAALLRETDVPLLEVAFDDAVAAFAGWSRPVDAIPAHVLADPVAAVRAAYVLARDLAVVEFDDETFPIHL